MDLIARCVDGELQLRDYDKPDRPVVCVIELLEDEKYNECLDRLAKHICLFRDERSIVESWRTEDVQTIREDLSNEQAVAVLAEAHKRFDASVGINWDVLKTHAQQLFPKVPV